MENQEILSKVDHTLLKATADWKSITALAEEALKYNMAAVCIPPSYVGRLSNEYPNLNICTVIGFPLGYETTAVKNLAALEAIGEGANEIDMVINIGDVKNGDFDKVQQEITLLKNSIGNHVLKVIVETCCLTKEEKIKLCKIVTDSGADFIKTSTGFGTGGATKEDVLLFKEHIGANVKIKAAGGIRTKEELTGYLTLGCDRIGASSALTALGLKNS